MSTHPVRWSIFIFVFTTSALLARPVAVDEGSTASPILRVGENYPGRPGELVGEFNLGPSPFRASMPDSFGNITFSALRASDLGSDVLLYHSADGSISPLVQTGATTNEGFALDEIWGSQVTANSSGQVLAYGTIRDVASGNQSTALLSIPSAGNVSVAAAVNLPVPNQPSGSFLSNLISTNGFSGITYNLNDSGQVAYESVFKIGSTQRQGVYTWTQAGGLKRIIDSTQAVPNHATASWVSLVLGSPDDIPFDPFQLQWTDSNEAIFLTRFKIGSTLYRGLYRGSVANGLSAIVDSARGDQVPGRPAGVGFFSIAGSPLANHGGAVSFQGIENSQFNRGVYYQPAAGQAVVKLHDNNDAVAGMPVGSKQLLFDLLAMSDTGNTLFNTTYRDGDNLNAALMMSTPGGETKLIARADQLAGLPADATLANFHGTTAINDAGDVLTEVSYDSESRSRATVYAYLNDTQQLVRVLAPGDILDGKQVDDFEIFMPPSSGGFGNTFTDDRRFIASVHLIPLPGAPGDETDSWGLYNFQVIPEPTCVGAIGLILLPLMRRRRRD